MKNSFVALVMTGAVALTGITKADAQMQASVGYPELLAGRETISRKALKDFEKSYKNVTNETWMKTKDGYFAKFNANGVRNKIFYSSNGNWAGVVKSYDEFQLPAEVRELVKSKYYDYSIMSVDEVETVESAGVPTYLVQLEDKKTLKTVRVSDGQMDVWKEYTKSKF